MLVADVLDGARIRTRLSDKFSIDTDQPLPHGEDTAPAPFDLFLAGIAACAGYYAQRYCRKWQLPHEGIRVELEPVFNPQHALTDVRLTVKAPAGFPEEHIAGLMRNVAACPVKKALETPPALTTEFARG